MATPTNAVDQIIRDEGEVLKMYRDSRGIWTIGVGHNLEAKAISKRASRAILEDDFEEARKTLYQHLPWTATLDEKRLAVLINMSFNMGIDGLLEFKNTLELVRLGKYSEAAAAMLQSKWARQVGDGPGGKFDRAERLAKQMQTGEWQ